MNIILNGKNIETESKTVDDLAISLGLPKNGVAVAINNQMVPRSDWKDKSLREGDSVVIIKAACGG